RIKRLLVQIQVTAHRLQFAKEAHQILQAAAEPVDGPGGNHVDLPCGGILQQLIECWSLVPALGTTDAGILVELNNLPSRASGDRLQFTALVLCRLTISRDAKIDADPLCHDPKSPDMDRRLLVAGFSNEIRAGYSGFPAGFSVWAKTESSARNPAGFDFVT